MDVHLLRELLPGAVRLFGGLNHQTSVVGKVPSVIDDESRFPNKRRRKNARLGKHDARIAWPQVLVPAAIKLSDILLLEYSALQAFIIGREVLRGFWILDQSETDPVLKQLRNGFVVDAGIANDLCFSIIDRLIKVESILDAQHGQTLLQLPVFNLVPRNCEGRLIFLFLHMVWVEEHSVFPYDTPSYKLFAFYRVVDQRIL